MLEKIDVYDADNVVLDLGFLYLTGFNSLRIGAFLQSFGLETAYEVEKIRMPQQLKLEISAEVWGNLESPNRLTLLAQAIHPNDADERMHLGAEAVLMDALVLRGGYKFGYDEEDFTVGAGLRFIRKMKRVHLDLAYMQHAQLDNTVRTTLALEL